MLHNEDPKTRAGQIIMSTLVEPSLDISRAQKATVMCGTLLLLWLLVDTIMQMMLRSTRIEGRRLTNQIYFCNAVEDVYVFE